MFWVCQLQKLRLSNFFASVRFKTTVSGYRCGDVLHGYTVDGVENIPDIDAHVVQLSHNQTGARHLHVACEDRNNTFSVGFRTTPMDSTGVSHILEHVTLCGSKKYPVRDPFFKMLTRSLSNFMNAFTANDWTMYIFSSQNARDFQNLLSVYLDCVFFPQLRYLDFCQEGWRLEHMNVEDKSSPIVFKGVVFNEMKGYFANPESVYAQALQNKLFPSHTYSNVSGGRPINIVDLLFENMKEFHSTHYHPSNSYFFSYGDIPVENHLRMINDLVLSKFNQIPLMAKLPYEERWTVPRNEHIFSAPDPSLQDPLKHTTYSMSYLLAPITDNYESFVLNVLSSLMTDGPASAFHESLLKKNIGYEFSPCSGYNDDTLESYFSIGLQGLKENDVLVVEDLISSTFKQLAECGFSNDRVESVLHQIELGIKDKKRNFGLTLITSLMSPWIHGANPIDCLKIDQLIKKFKVDLRANKNFIQDKILEYFISNNHHLRLTMTHNVEYEYCLKRDEAEKLSRKLSESKAVHEKIYEQGISLRKDQNSISDISCLPTVLLSDVDSQIEALDVNVINGLCPIQLCIQPTNGLSYLRIAINFNHLPEDIKMFVPLFCYVITRMGTEDYSYSQFAQLCDKYSNGFSVVPVVTADHTLPLGFYEELLCTSYCLNKNFEQMVSLWENLFKRPNLKDKDRLCVLLKQASNNMAMRIAEAGHTYAMRLSSSTILPSSKYSEKLFGITQIKFLNDLSKKNEFSEVLHKFELIARVIFDMKYMRLSVNTNAGYIDITEQILKKSFQSLPCSSHFFPTMTKDKLHHSEYGNQIHVELPYPVNYVGRSFKSVQYSHEDSSRLHVLANLLTSKFLHREVREIGGAYGSAALQRDGIFSFMSYRDPNTLLTLSVFDKCLDWIKLGKYTEDDVNEAKLLALSQIDSPISPGNKGSLLFLKRLSDKQLQYYRDSIFHITKHDMILCQRYFNTAKSNTCVIGDENKDLIKNWTKLKF